jgi:hypothetical protein
MKATVPWLAAAAALLSLASLSTAQCYYPVPHAPDMCGPGSYWSNCYGQVYGPGYNVRPPYPPYQGMIFGPNNNGGGGPGGAFGDPSFATHPFARSPRDYFMAYESVNDWFAPPGPAYSAGYASFAAYQAGTWGAAGSVGAVAPVAPAPPIPAAPR